MKDHEDISYCAAAIVPEEPLYSQIIGLSQMLGEQFGSWYVLSDRVFPAHITIWIAYIPTRNIPILVDSFSRLIDESAFFELQLAAPTVDSSGFVASKVNPSEALNTLHKSLLGRLNGLREGFIDRKYLDRMDSLPEAQRLSVSAYGTRFAGELYEGHATLGFVDKSFVEEVRSVLPKDPPEPFVSRRAIVFRQAESGKSIQLLCEAAFG